MNPALKRGFKSYAETLALETRGEICLEKLAPFDPRALADHLAIPICSLRELADYGVTQASIRHFQGVGRGDFSALTVVVGTYRLIVENPVHAPTRRTNSLAHELSHVLLEHEPGPAFDGAGCREWRDRDEAEADWLAGVLLVPRGIALSIARLKTPVEVAAAHYGVSTKLMTWRLNQSGAVVQARREVQARKTRTPS